MRVLIATDGSDCARHALAEALRLLPMQGAEVAVVAVAPPIGVEPMAGAGVEPLMTAAPELEGELVRHHLREAQAACEAAGLHPRLIARAGDPATEILDVAARLHPDVVVLGSHGRGPLGRMFLGSVSDTVSHRWPGAALIVPLPKAA